MAVQPMSETIQMRFWSPEFFGAAASSLNGSPVFSPLFRWLETKIIAECSDTGVSFLIGIKDGVVTTRLAAAGEPADFKFSAPYAEWVSVIRDGAKLQAEVVKGKVKFRGSMPKMLLLLGKVSRAEQEIVGQMRSMNPEY
jgi:SCP-2 sterol transfer family